MLPGPYARNSPLERDNIANVTPHPGTETASEQAIAARESSLQGETLWYRLIAGGTSPRSRFSICVRRCATEW